MRYLTLYFLIFSFHISLGQEDLVNEENLTIDQFTDGTLTLPNNFQTGPLVIFIQGSGPVNRDGNAPMMKNDGMKKIAQALADQGIAAFRYDKRIFKMDRLKLRKRICDLKIL